MPPRSFGRGRNITVGLGPRDLLITRRGLDLGAGVGVVKRDKCCEAGLDVWTDRASSQLHLFVTSTQNDARRALAEKAEFESFEGVLALSLEMNKLGQIVWHVYITPDHLTQKHMFDEAISQSYLLTAISGLQSLSTNMKWYRENKAIRNVEIILNVGTNFGDSDNLHPFA